MTTACSPCSWWPQSGRWTSSTPSTADSRPPRCTSLGEEEGGREGGLQEANNKNLFEVYKE